MRLQWYPVCGKEAFSVFSPLFVLRKTGQELNASSSNRCVEKYRVVYSKQDLIYLDEHTVAVTHKQAILRAIIKIEYILYDFRPLFFSF